MGGNKRQKRSSSKFSSFFGFFKTRRSHSHRVEDASWDDVLSANKVWPSDEDRRYWVAEPGIDGKASDFIAKFHASHVFESERQSLPPYQPDKAA